MGSLARHSVTRKVYRLRSLPYAKICFWVAAMAFSVGLAEIIVRSFDLGLLWWPRTIALLLVGVLVLAVCALVVKMSRSAGAFGCLGGSIIAFMLFAMIVPAVMQVCDASSKMEMAKRLRTVAHAIRAYAEARGNLPPAALYDEAGKPLVSWRVLILPYLGDDARELYQSFHLNEPWDSPHNIALVSLMPEVYAPSWNCPPDTTLCKVFVGEGAVFERGSTLSVPRIAAADGVEQTILVAAAGVPVLWTKPEDILFDQSRPDELAAYVIGDGRGFRKYLFQAATVDGIVHTIQIPSDTNGWKNLRNAITWRGGETVDLNR